MRGEAVNTGPTGGNSGPSFSNGPVPVWLRYLFPPEVLGSRVTFWDLI